MDLILAAQRGDINAVRAALESGLSPDSADTSGVTGLHLASQNGHCDIVELLLVRRANVNLSSKSGRTALMQASQNGHTGAVRLLVEYGAAVDVSDSQGRTAILEASQLGYTETARVLLYAGARADTVDQEGLTALVYSCYNGHADTVKVLLDAESQGSSQDHHVTSLVLSANKGHEDIVRLLLRNEGLLHTGVTIGARGLIQASQADMTNAVGVLLQCGIPVDAADQTGRTALMHASQQGHTDTVKLLLEAGARVNVVDQEGRTSLLVASDKGHSDIVRLLLEKLANDPIPENDNATMNALRRASYHGHTDTVRVLLNTGSNTNQPVVSCLVLAADKGHADIVRMLLTKAREQTSASDDATKALIQASQVGMTNAVLMLLKCGLNVNAADHNGRTGLMQASQQGHVSTVQALLKAGANVDAVDLKRVTSLWLATQQGHTGIIKQLLENGADVNVREDYGRSALTQASQKGHTDIVRLLLEAGAGIDVTDSMGVTALQLACQNGHTDTVKLLLDKGATIDLASTHGRTALLEASEAGHDDVVRVLLQNGANVDVADREGYTSLFVASDKGHSHIVELLLKNGAKDSLVQQRGGIRRSALIRASWLGHTDTVKVLLDSSPRTEIPEQHIVSSLVLSGDKGYRSIVRLLLNLEDPRASNGAKSLIHASQSGMTDAVRELLQCGVRVDSADQSGRTPLLHASQQGHLGTVKVLLQAGAKVEIKDDKGFTSLMLACQKGYSDITKLLLSRRANVNTLGPEGRTALMYASEAGHGDIVRMLLMSGAKFDVADSAGVTALLAACSKGHIDPVRLLLEHGAKVIFSQQKSAARNALMQATYHGHADIMKMLLEAGAKFDIDDQEDLTAFVYSSYSGDIDAVRLLLKRESGIELSEKHIVNSLVFAGENGHSDIVRLLLEKQVAMSSSSSCGTKALIQASQSGMVNAVRMLLQCGISANVADPNGATSLLQASQQGHTDTVRVLLGSGAKVDVADHKGVTSVWIASQQGHTDVVRLLLEKGADINIPEEFGRTALIQASQQGHSDTVRVLLEAGANVNLADQEGCTSLLVASTNGHTGIVRMLLGKGANANLAANNGRTALIQGSQNGHSETVKVLLEWGARADLADSKGATSLLIACQNGYNVVSRQMIGKEDADVLQTHGSKTRESSNKFYATIEPNTLDIASSSRIASEVTTGRWDIVQVLIEAGSDVFQNNLAGEMPIMYIALGAYQDPWANDYLKQHLQGNPTFDALNLCDYAMSFASFILVGAFRHSKTLPDPFCCLFVKLASESPDSLAKPLYGYLPEGLHQGVQYTNVPFSPYQGVEGKLSLHTLGTAILCKLPTSDLQWLTAEHRDYLTNMLGQTPLHLLAMENHHLSDMEERMAFITERLGFSFSETDSNGRLSYHLAAVWCNSQFVLCGAKLDPGIMSHMRQCDHVGNTPAMYLFPSKKSQGQDVCSLMTRCSTLCQHLLQRKERLTLSTVRQLSYRPVQLIKLVGMHFQPSMQLTRFQKLADAFRQISITEKDIVSLLKDHLKGVVDLDGQLYRDWIGSTIALLRIIGREMGKIDPMFECVPSLKGSIQECTKCGTMDEVDLSVKLVKFTQHFRISLLKYPNEAHGLDAKITPLSLMYWKTGTVHAFSSVEFCTDFWLCFMEALQTSAVRQYMKETGLVIENCKRKHGFVGMLNVCCSGSSSTIHPISVDVTPCVESESLCGYAALVRPRHYDNKMVGPESNHLLELSSSKKDWDFLKYVPLEVLCGYTLVKLLRSLADTFQTESGKEYTAEDILPSYMVKTSLLWILDPENKFDCVYHSLDKEKILKNESVDRYRSDVFNLCQALMQHPIDDSDIPEHLLCLQKDMFGAKWYKRVMETHSMNNFWKDQLRIIRDKCKFQADSLSVRERTLPYVLIGRCRTLRVQNGIGNVIKAWEDAGAQSLQQYADQYGAPPTPSLKHPAASFPDISEGVARRGQLWAVRMLRLLPHLLRYEDGDVSGVVNYYLPAQEVYARDKELTVTFCHALVALLHK